TFFVVYSDFTNDHTADHSNPALGFTAQLDFTNHNSFIPGNCMACHGIESRYTQSTDPNPLTNDFGVKSARFLPFDLSAFKYFSDDPHDPLSRAAQDSEFFALNYLVARTSISLGNPEFNELLGGWYFTPPAHG